MAKIFITGSSAGLGLMAAQLLIEQGHAVVLHGRDQAKAEVAMRAAPGAQAVVVGDVSRLADCRMVAEQVNRLGRFDAVIHNAGIGYREPKRLETEDGHSQLFATNVLAPFVLTALVERTERLVYLSSGMHARVEPNLDDLDWTQRRWNGAQAYAETKLYDVMLAFGIARLWPTVRANALEPGWVPTQMGGPGAPDDIDKAHRTQAWLATSSEPLALSSGAYFRYQALHPVNPAAKDESLQDQLVAACERLSGIRLPK